MTYAKAPSIQPGWKKRRKLKLLGRIPTLRHQRFIRSVMKRTATKATKQTEQRQSKRPGIIEQIKSFAKSLNPF